MLKEQIKADTITALKQKEAKVTEVLRMAQAAITAKEKEIRYKLLKEKPDTTEDEAVKATTLSDEQVLEVLITEVKKRRDAIALYQQGNRPELAQNEQQEIEILQKYLPEQLSEEELRGLIQVAITKTGAKEIKDTGKIMADLMPSIKGKADNAIVSKIIKELLSH